MTITLDLEEAKAFQSAVWKYETSAIAAAIKVREDFSMSVDGKVAHFSSDAYQKFKSANLKPDIFNPSSWK